MTLAAPTKDNFSTVIVNDSEYPMTYTLQTKNMKLKADRKLELGRQRAATMVHLRKLYEMYSGITADSNGVYSFAA